MVVAQPGLKRFSFPSLDKSRSVLGVVCDRVIFSFVKQDLVPSRVIFLFLPVCANQDPITSCQKQHIRKTYTHILTYSSGALTTCEVLIASGPGCMCFCVRLQPEQCCICTPGLSSPPPPCLSPRPAVSQSYPSNWHHTGSSRAVASAWGQRVHINLSSKRPTPTAMLVMMFFSQTNVSWEKSGCS